MSDPTIALIRLREFRRGWNTGDVVDDASGLTADDLDLIIEKLAPPFFPAHDVPPEAPTHDWGPA